MLTVQDLMKRDVVTVRMEDSARTLARVLADSEISGVPVVDAQSRVVGVVSATDLVRLAADEADVTLWAVTIRPDIERTPDPDADLEDVIEADALGFFLPEDSPFQGTELLDQVPESSFDSVTIADLMTPVTFSVRPQMPVDELCEFLVRGRIHRALVVEDDELVGIITSQDVLKAVAEHRLEVE
jgi:predicted transcriptional regulator